MAGADFDAVQLRGRLRQGPGAVGHLQREKLGPVPQRQHAKAQGRNINAGQALFGTDELNYISSHYVYLDHDQKYTLSGGGHYHFGDSKVSANFLYGSCLHMSPDGGAPNSGHFPSYFTVNTALTHTWKNTLEGRIEGRLALINLFDRSYLLRDGSGVGVGAPQYGARRSACEGLSTSF